MSSRSEIFIFFNLLLPLSQIKAVLEQDAEDIREMVKQKSACKCVLTVCDSWARDGRVTRGAWEST